VLLSEPLKSSTEAGPHPVVDHALLAAVLLLVAWGALAFGAVYPWAYTPLFWTAALVGVATYWRARAIDSRSPSALILLALLTVVALAALGQTVPLPDGVRLRLSPATESFLRQVDVGYAAAVTARDQGLTTGAPVAPRPLSLNPASTTRGVLMLGSLLLLLTGLIRFFGQVGLVRLTAWVIGLGVLLAGIGIVQKALLGDHAFAGMKIYGFWEPRYKLTTPFGPYVNRNHYAGWMVMALPLAIGYLLALTDSWLRRGRRGWRDRLLALSSPEGARIQLVAFAIVLMGSALALTMSRSGIACFVLASLLAAVVGTRGARSFLARAGLSAALLVLVAAAFAWADVDVAKRFTSGGQSIELRRQAWTDAAAIIRDFPLVGTGLNTYGTATLTYKTARTDLHFQEAHNDYLQLAAEGGLLLGIPALLAVVFCVRAIRRRFVEDAQRPASYWLRFGASMGLLAIALQSIVEFSLQLPGNAVFFVVLLAAALHRTPEAGPDANPNP
jgi:O-antigen ligase